MPRRRNTTKYRNVQPRNVKKAVNAKKGKCENIEIPPAPELNDSADNEQQYQDKENVIQVAAQIHSKYNQETDLAHKNTTVLKNSIISDAKILEELESSSQQTFQNTQTLPKMTSSVLCSLPVEPLLLPNNDAESGPSIVPHPKTQIAALDLTNKNATISTTVNTNGAIILDTGTIDVLDSSQPELNIIQPHANEISVLLLATVPPLNNVPDEKHEKFNNTELHNISEPPISPSTITEEILVRTSHDPENNVVLEEIDIVINTDQPLDTSTPLASPSTSTILDNIESGNISSFHINTPTSSLCANSSIHDKTYAPSGSDDATGTESGTRQTKKKRKVKKRSDIGRIRHVNKPAWIDTKRKQLKNQGLSYVSRNGKVRPEKSLLPACDDDCRLKCKQKVDENVRKEMFKKYWSLGDRVRQWDLLTRWCEKIGKRRITTEGPSKRKFSIRYYLPNTLSNVNGDRVIVCKKMFLQTFAIGEGVVRTALKKFAGGDGLLVESDERGRHANHPKVKTTEMIKSVCDHVKSFTPVEAHYTRKDSSKLYLDSELTMSKMFKLYLEWVKESNSSRPARTLRQYTDIVNENFNIEFHRPKKDQCDECIAYKNLPKPVPQDAQEKYDEHLRNKAQARSLKDQDKLSAIGSPSTTVTAAFDFQKVHSSPHAETSILYYKRKLNVFNFTIFEMGQKVGKCYMWHEGTAKRGANEVASCVYDFIREQSTKGVQKINLYSDNCGGQNRNRIVFMMYLIAAQEFQVNITHRFFEKGHTVNENDSIHALIERCAKSKEIYTPDQWFALVRWAKETGEPYIVKEIATEDILDFKKLLIGKNWTKNEKSQKILWSKIREVNVSASEPDVLNYKYKFDEAFNRIFVRRTQNRRRQNQTNDDLIQAYTGPLPIPNAKLADLNYLCDHNIIPKQYHAFYMSLKSGDVIDSSSDNDEE